MRVAKGWGSNGKQHFVLMQKRAVAMVADNKNVFAQIPLTFFTAFNFWHMKKIKYNGILQLSMT
jgi:hypothetical protein